MVEWVYGNQGDIETTQPSWGNKCSRVGKKKPCFEAYSIAMPNNCTGPCLFCLVGDLGGFGQIKRRDTGKALRIYSHPLCYDTDIIFQTSFTTKEVLVMGIGRGVHPLMHSLNCSGIFCNIFCVGHRRVATSGSPR